MRTRRPILSSVAGALLLLTGLGTIFAAPSAGAAAAPPSQGWTTLEAPLPNDANSNPQVYLDSSSCPAAGACVTVGSYRDTSSDYWGVIETQSGTAWTEFQAPEPSGYGTGSHQFAEFGGSSCGLENPCDAVSCPSTTVCVAVGIYEDSVGSDFGWIDTGYGNTWTSSAAPEPSADAGTEGDGHQQASLQSVSCTSTTSCVAVGEYENTAGHDEELIDVLSGTTWTAVSPPTPPSNQGTGSDSYSQLFFVSCVSSTFCAASGSYLDTSGRTNGLLTTLSGTTWAAAAAPLPGNAGTDGDSELLVETQGVSCASATLCVAVGLYFDATGHGNGLIDQFNGTTWSTLGPAIEPSGFGTASDQSAYLGGVSCPTTTFCVAVGNYEDSNTVGWTMLDTFDGSTWSATQGPEPSNTEPASDQSVALYNVDCPTVSFCMAAGQYRANVSGGTSMGMVDTLSAGTWSALSVPMPSNLKAGSATGYAKYLACASPVACVISGGYSDSSSDLQGYLDTYTGLQGYWLGASDGGVFGFGNAGYFGSVPAQLKAGQVLNKPIVGMAATPDGQGYWMVASDGGIFGFGDAAYEGGTGGTHLNQPIVGMAATPDGKGYWLVASDGGIFAEGDATFYGSTGAIKLNKPIVGMAATPDGKGYWLVASDGGIFTFGDATYQGSTGNIHLNKPIVGMAADPNGDGYWLVASDGGIFTFGNTHFYGSTGAITLNKPIVGMASSPSGLGYWLVASDGGIFTFGDAVFDGSTGAIALNKPIVGMAT
ncbi:MAG TPA: hypothetical protein VGF87_10300 [Acidimicrobiales bacterium]|jgi:hypothetical protein